MKIKTINGHLTPTNKTAIKAIIQAHGAGTYMVNRIQYKLEKISENVWSVITTKTESDWFESKKVSHRSEFVCE